MKLNPIATFRVYPEKKSLYFTVKVWRTIKDLRTANPGNSDTIALCRCRKRLRLCKQRNRMKFRMMPELGEVHLCRRHLKAGVIAHEFTHAAIIWAARKHVMVELAPQQVSTYGLLNLNHPEEQFCHALGWMVAQCVDQLYRKKVLT